jgi:AAA15 family ATPase/GTPase
MGDLVLDSLEIQGFRGFRHLQIEKLGRVNLIVGKNNVGKSSLLEALQIYAKKADPLLIFHFLQSRDESMLIHSNYSVDSVSEQQENLLLSFRYLFYGRETISSLTKPIQIGAINSPERTLSLEVKWYARVTDEQGISRSVLLQPEEDGMVENSEPRFALQFGYDYAVNYPLNGRRIAGIKAKFKEINSIYAKTSVLDMEAIGKLWDNIALTGSDNDVLEALRIIAPGVEGFALVEDRTTHLTERITGEYGRIPVVKIAGINERLPLGHLGDGMQCILSIMLALVNSRDGIVLIDEFENGLYYAVQLDLWRLIFRLALRLNIQVFATTHSWDCIEAFQKAAQENEQAEGMLISLEKSKSDVEAILYNEEELKVVTRERIEVR